MIFNFFFECGNEKRGYFQPTTPPRFWRLEAPPTLTNNNLIKFNKMATTIFQLDAEQVLDIRALSGLRAYNSTDENSRLFGKQYRTFIYDGKAFVVESEDAFCKDVDNDNVFQVKLDETEEGLTFISHRSLTKQRAASRAKIDIAAYTVEFVQSAMKFNPEELVD